MAHVIYRVIGNEIKFLEPVVTCKDQQTAQNFCNNLNKTRNKKDKSTYEIDSNFCKECANVGQKILVDPETNCCTKCGWMEAIS